MLLLTVLGNALRSAEGGKFSTYDQDNDEWETNSCAEERSSGWWFYWEKEDEEWNWIPCSKSNINGLYTMVDNVEGEVGQNLNRNCGVQFFTLTPLGYFYSLKSTAMKMKPY